MNKKWITASAWFGKTVTAGDVPAILGDKMAILNGIANAIITNAQGDGASQSGSVDDAWLNQQLSTYGFPITQKDAEAFVKEKLSSSGIKPTE